VLDGGEMKTDVVYKKAVEKWGVASQIKMAIEECGELIVKLCKLDRKVNGSTLEELSAEIADVEIMLEQIKEMFKISNIVKFHKKLALEKLEEMVVK